MDERVPKRPTFALPAVETTEGYDWQREKQQKIRFYDDGTMTYFW